MTECKICGLCRLRSNTRDAARAPRLTSNPRDNFAPAVSWKFRSRVSTSAKTEAARGPRAHQKHRWRCPTQHRCRRDPEGEVGGGVQGFFGSRKTEVNWETAPQRTSQTALCRRTRSPPPQHERAWSHKRSSNSPQRTQEVSESHLHSKTVKKINAKERRGEKQLHRAGLQLGGQRFL